MCAAPSFVEGFDAPHDWIQLPSARARNRLVDGWGESMAAGQRSGDRNLRILEAFLSGTSVQELADHYQLSRDRIGVIVRAERLKIEVSPMVEYRQLRGILKLR